MRRQDIHLRLPLNKGGDHVLSSPLRIPRELTRRYAIRWRNLKWPQVEAFGWPPGGRLIFLFLCVQNWWRNVLVCDDLRVYRNCEAVVGEVNRWTIPWKIIGCLSDLAPRP